MFRYSLGTLLIVMALIGLGCAAFVNASPLWAEVMVTTTVAILTAGLVAALVGSRRVRAFALGFAATGWIYFWLAFFGAGGVGNQLLTTRAVVWAHSLQADAAPAPSASANVYPTTVVGMPIGGNTFVGGYTYTQTGAFVSVAPAYATFMAPVINIGQALWTLLLAGLGGVIACAVDKRSRQPEPPAEPRR